MSFIGYERKEKNQDIVTTGIELKKMCIKSNQSIKGEAVRKSAIVKGAVPDISQKLNVCADQNGQIPLCWIVIMAETNGGRVDINRNANIYISRNANIYLLFFSNIFYLCLVVN